MLRKNVACLFYFMKQITLIITILFLASCAPSSSNSGVQSVRSLQAQQLAEISRLDAELRELNGKIDEVKFGLERSIEQINAQLGLVAQAVPAPSVVPQEILDEDEKIVAKLQGEAADILREGLQQLRLGNFAKAKSSFDKFATEYSSDLIDDNVTFWRAFTNLQLGSTDQAIVLYSDVFQKYPKSDRADDALYYIAEVFSKNSETSDAQSALKKLLADYPGSSYEVRARALLATL